MMKPTFPPNRVVHESGLTPRSALIFGRIAVFAIAIMIGLFLVGLLTIAFPSAQQTVPGPPAARLLPVSCSNGQTATFTSATGLWACTTAAAGTVTSASVVTANGVSASTATSTTTPAHTFTLGVITPTSVTSRFVASGSAPTAASVGANSCGTTAPSVAGNDNTGIVTVGATSGTQCRVTFTAAAATRWQCVVNNETTANLARTTYVDASNVDFLGTFVGLDVLSYICMPR